MIGQFSLNFEEIVVDIRSGTKFMTGVASEFVKPTTSLKIEFIRRKTKIAFFFLSECLLYLLISNRFTFLRTILYEGIFKWICSSETFSLNWWIF